MVADSYKVFYMFINFFKKNTIRQLSKILLENLIFLSEKIFTGARLERIYQNLGQSEQIVHDWEDLVLIQI